MKFDDSTVSEEQWTAIRSTAEKILRDADAIGVFPTPVDHIMRTARIEVLPIALDDDYLAILRRNAEHAGRALLSALSKIWGIFDAQARIAFVDPETPKEKLPFLKLHEGGHGLLPWQSIFGLFEDCRKTLDPDVKLQFEREANVFASDVLFQLNGFSIEAADSPFGINVPLRLSKRYGASVYSAIRRYVAHNERACALLVLNPPETLGGNNTVSSLRRAVGSPAFETRFANFPWPEVYMSGSGLGRLVPYRRMARPQTLSLKDANGEYHEFIGESFKTPHQTFILLHATRIIPRRLVVPALQAFE